MTGSSKSFATQYLTSSSVTNCPHRHPVSFAHCGREHTYQHTNALMRWAQTWEAQKLSPLIFWARSDRLAQLSIVVCCGTPVPICNHKNTSDSSDQESEEANSVRIQTQDGAKRPGGLQRATARVARRQTLGINTPRSGAQSIPWCESRCTSRCSGLCIHACRACVLPEPLELSRTRAPPVPSQRPTLHAQGNSATPCWRLRRYHTTAHGCSISDHAVIQRQRATPCTPDEKRWKQRSVSRSLRRCVTRSALRPRR